MEKKVLLIGYPNSGKSTLFNQLCGTNQKIVNYSGVTVDTAHASIRFKGEEHKISLVDLPGIYTLLPQSHDEGVTLDALINAEKNAYNLIILTVDTERLEGSLLVAKELSRKYLSENILLVLSKDDAGLFDQERISYLESELGMEIISVGKKRGHEHLKERIVKKCSENSVHPKAKFELSQDSLEYMPRSFELNALVEIKNDRELLEQFRDLSKSAQHLAKNCKVYTHRKNRITKALDRIYLHPFWGGVFFFLTFYLIFHSVYTLATPLMDLIDMGVGALAAFIGGSISNELLRSFFVDGIIGGVGGIIVFFPQIIILFFLITLLENTGYISRAAVISDRIMSLVGLNGKAFLPYLSGFACSIPGIMATRTIEDKRERLATMITLPMITCSARLPVYILLVGVFVPNEKVLGFFNLQALSFFLLYFLGSFFALFMALVFRLTIFKGRSQAFVMDLPLYQRPSLRMALSASWVRGKQFLSKAGTVIMGFSILVWVASTFPRVNQVELSGLSSEQQAAYQLEKSFIGHVGKAIEPALKPIGMDWRIGVSIVASLAARELFVSTMGTVLALGEVDEESDTLRERLVTVKNQQTGEPLFNASVAWAILIFFVFSLQCMSTIAVLKKESGGYKIPIFAFLYMGTLGYLGSFLVYNFF